MLYSSQLQYNLISIIKLIKKRIETLFSLLIKTSKLLMNDDVITVVDIINKQYVLRENFTNSYRKNSIESELRALAKLADLEIHIWHARIKHLRYDNLIKLQSQVDEMNLIDQKSTKICESCMIDRQKRNVNRTSRTSVSKFLEIVHSNLRESLSRTRSDHAYYITFRDDWSNVIWVCWFISTVMIRFKSVYCMWSLLLNDDTRFDCYLMSGLYVRCVGHMTHANLMRSGYLPTYLVDKTFGQTECICFEIKIRHLTSSKHFRSTLSVLMMLKSSFWERIMRANILIKNFKIIWSNKE
jgi:hypothetical protein